MEGYLQGIIHVFLRQHVAVLDVCGVTGVISCISCGPQVDDVLVLPSDDHLPQALIELIKAKRLEC